MKRLLPFRRGDCITLASILFVATSALSYAQPTSITALSGIQYRFHGDTIWRERDSTAIQSIYRRDTLYRSTYVFGKKTGSETIVVQGDSAKVVETRDASGKFVTSSRMIGTSAASFEVDRLSIEAAFRLADTEERMRAANIRADQMEERARASGISLPARPSLPTIDYLPKVKQVYAMTANRNIEQLGDTVWYIDGCSARPPVDTTVYRLFGTDSVRRVSPAPRTFDALMARAVRGDMNSGFTRQRVLTGDNPAMKNVPNFDKWPCDRRSR